VSEQSKKKVCQTNLPCHWVEEEGFEVTPRICPTVDPGALSDTSFLLKSKFPQVPPPRPLP
jgi:hypothetical protein